MHTASRPSGCSSKGLPSRSSARHDDVLRTRDELVETGHRQAAFAVLARAAFEHADLRVDQHQRLLAVLGDVHHDHAPVHVDLGRREPDAGRRVHGLEHVVDQLLHRRVDLFDRLGDGAQPRVGEFEDVQDGHDCERVPVSCAVRARLRRHAPHAAVNASIVYPNDVAASVTPRCRAIRNLSGFDYTFAKPHPIGGAGHVRKDKDN